MEGTVMDIVVRNDRQAALDVLHNIWYYKEVESLHLEGCSLSDGDIAEVAFEAPSVRYVCMRSNCLRSPWKHLAEKFPNMEELDCRDNRKEDVLRCMFPLLERLNNAPMETHETEEGDVPSDSERHEDWSSSASEIDWSGSNEEILDVLR
ncbi:hypothetical protein ANCCAN_12912 [Ancylostoma caninum]|uniref:Leucine Rich repeat-containing domain protein n=1 Tax=Ancylostoma caninum TaxID=29170 RepID=A0A368G9S1_ANCCA|nr:hypothetical protein ANCCAN_12912 [Ancylostoma caninum]